MRTKKNNFNLILLILILILLILLGLQRKKYNKSQPYNSVDTVTQIFYDTIFTEKIIHDTVFRTLIKTKIKTKISYVDTTPLVINKRRSFLYIKDTFNIEDRTYYITEKDDTVKTFYFDYTYYIFKYHFQDTLVKVDSVLGCDLYTHRICDNRDRIVIFHTCEGESRMIINMLNRKGK